MNYVIAGGTGFIGQALVKQLLDAGHKITIIGRDRAKIQAIFAEKVTSVTWQQLSIKHLQNAKVVINLAGANIGSKRWTATRKEELTASRIIPTQTLAQLCAKLGVNSPPLLNASGVGIYGLQAGTSDGLSSTFDEKSTIEPIFIPPQLHFQQLGHKADRRLGQTAG